MPLEFEIDTDAAIVRLRASGILTLPEIRSTVDALLAHSDFRPGLSILSDQREIERAATRDLVLGVVPMFQQLADRLGTFRVAVVVWKDSSFGMARMTEVYAEPTPATVRAFRDVEEAEAWLLEEPC